MIHNEVKVTQWDRDEMRNLEPGYVVRLTDSAALRLIEFLSRQLRSQNTQGSQAASVNENRPEFLTVDGEYFTAVVLPKDQIVPDQHTIPSKPFTRFSVLLPDKGTVLDDVERDLVVQALIRANGNKSAAARLLGLTRDQLRYRVRKYLSEGSLVTSP